MNPFRIPCMFTLVTLLLLASVSVVTAEAYGEYYGWTLSFTDTDPEQNVGPAFPGFGTVYLWMFCNQIDGAAAYGANVTATNGAFIAGFTPVAGVLNAGTATALALAIGGCPNGPIVIGSFTVVGTATDMCMDTAITVDCDQITPTEWASAVRGLSAGGGTICETGDLCIGDATAASSWGAIKGLYR